MSRPEPIEFVCPKCSLKVPMSEKDWPLLCGCGRLYKSVNDTGTPKKSRGLGDTIAKLTTAIGIKPCGGCKERQEWLNRMLPYK